MKKKEEVLHANALEHFFINKYYYYPSELNILSNILFKRNNDIKKESLNISNALYEFKKLYDYIHYYDYNKTLLSVVDILDIIKNCCLKLKFNNPKDILSLDESKLKTILIEYANDKLKVSTTMAAINSNINGLAIKHSYCLDLFDNDMGLFIPNLLTPIIEKYSTTITSLLLHPNGRI
jgi:hypothetical protein